MVENRARPCSSQLTPLGAPIGFSGDFSSVGSSVRSAHFFSASAGCRSRETSVIGLSGSGAVFLSAIFTVDDRRGGKRWAREGSDRLVGPFTRSVFFPFPTPSHTSTKHIRRGTCAAAIPPGRPGFRGE